MSEPRVCIVGAGNLSTRRIYPYMGAAGAVICGVCDLDGEKAARNARLWGGTVYDDMERMLDAEKPDGVIICIGPEAHAALAPVALRRGVPVYTEKPPAATAQQALEVARVARETGVLCVNAFKKRYTNAANRAREFISSFPPVSMYAISIDYASAQYGNDSLRRTFIHDFCIHIIDLICYLGGEVSEVFAFSKGMDAYAVSLRFASGAVGTLTLNDGRGFNIPTEETEISLRGGNCMTIHNSSSWRICQDGKCTEWREPPTFVSGGDSGDDTGHLAELRDFVTALREGRKTSRSSIFESYRSMVLYEGIVESAASGRVVGLRYADI